jgi:hypothetical protein
MKTYVLGLLAPLGLLMATGAACGSESSEASNDGGSADDDALVGHDTNPDGVPYPDPAGGYGRTARSGNTPGSVIQNFKFLGYPTLPGDGTYPSSPTTISMADYYDPCNKRYKLIHMSVASVWCVPCNEETDAIVAAKSQLDSEQVVVLQALDEGPTQGTGATLGDLQQWIVSHKSNFPEMLDPELQNLAGFFNAAAIPWNADLDPRTMEILDSTEGWSGDVSSEISLSVVPAQPSYPIPASAQCN